MTAGFMTVHRLYTEPRLGSPPLLSRIPMVQPTHTGNRDDLPYFPWLDGSLFRCVLFEPQMRPVLVVVIDVRADHAPKLALIDCNHMIQTIAP